MSTNDIRRAYIDFFRTKGHAIVPSAPLLPENDPTTLFTGSGMQPMLPYLLGEPHPLGKRIADSQKSFRSVDIEEVGDNRHTTFFEMLGNWSMGDYFKEEQIPWMFAFLTQKILLDPRHLYVTVFRGKEQIPRDDASVALWKEQFASVGMEARAIDNAEQQGLQDGRIFYYGEKKNWWSRAGEPEKMPVGEPGGPDSEMFWDFGAERHLHEQSPWKDRSCHVNCDCGRFLEIGNNVFMEYRKTEQGFECLPTKNVDFGGGLERIAAAQNDNPDIFAIDVFHPMQEELHKISVTTYGNDPTTTRAFRIIMDHVRAATFLIADGAPPSNKDQGYFTRRLIRRAIWFGNTIDLPTSDLCRFVATPVIQTYSASYPELSLQKDFILHTMDEEELQSRNSLLKGEHEVKKYLATHDSIDGTKVFYFFETHGVPRDVTEEIAKNFGKALRQPEHFDAAKESHQHMSRAASAGKFRGGLADHSAETTKLHTATHLLNAALRKVLGPHVQQKGSNITAERLRFDFNHGEKMTPEQIAEVEKIVNEAIESDLPIVYHLTTVDGAKGEGAIGVFDDRYAAEVKVYVVGDPKKNTVFSKEICGGPHVARTGMIGTFKIQKEESSSAGIRRIKATVKGGPQEIDVARETHIE